jgi:hypothetical protein
MTESILLLCSEGLLYVACNMLGCCKPEVASSSWPGKYTFELILWRATIHASGRCAVDL